MLLRHVDSGADSDLQEERDSLRTHKRGGGRSFGKFFRRNGRGSNGHEIRCHVSLCVPAAARC